MVIAAMKLKRQLLLGRKPMTNLDSELKMQRYYFANKDPCNQSYVFPVVMYDVRVGPYRRLSTEELMLSKCDVGEDS